MKKVLVTGATGFIGQYVVAELLRRGCHVIASSAHPTKAAAMDWFNRVTYIPFDFSHFDPAVNYYTCFQSPDLLLHLAWEGLPNYKAAFHIEENLPRHTALLRNLIQHGLSDVTVTGTCFEYGMAEGCLAENLPPAPANAYAIAKDRLRRELAVLLPEGHRWVRLFYMYGKGQHSNSLFSQLENALRSGEDFFAMSGGVQERDYLPVEKVAAYVVQIALQHAVTGIINCCSGQPVTVLDMVNRYLAATGRTIPLRLGVYPYSDLEPMHFWGDDTRLKLALQSSDAGD